MQILKSQSKPKKIMRTNTNKETNTAMRKPFPIIKRYISQTKNAIYILYIIVLEIHKLIYIIQACNLKYHLKLKLLILKKQCNIIIVKSLLKTK